MMTGTGKINENKNLGLIMNLSVDDRDSSVGQSDSDVKNPIYRSPIKNFPMADVGLGLVASQPTHASILLLMTCFA
jgi:hypothetical protein